MFVLCLYVCNICVVISLKRVQTYLWFNYCFSCFIYKRLDNRVNAATKSNAQKPKLKIWAFRPKAGLRSKADKISALGRNSKMFNFGFREVRCKRRVRWPFFEICVSFGIIGIIGKPWVRRTCYIPWTWLYDL